MPAPKSEREALEAGYIKMPDGSFSKPNKKDAPLPPTVTAASLIKVSQEIEQLHNPIIKWCRSQVPMVPYIHARPDRESTIAEGAADFIIFLRGKVLIIECKTSTGKLTKEQTIWHHLMLKQLFEVITIRSMGEFFTLVK